MWHLIVNSNYRLFGIEQASGTQMLKQCNVMWHLNVNSNYRLFCIEQASGTQMLKQCNVMWHLNVNSNYSWTLTLVTTANAVSPVFTQSVKSSYSVLHHTPRCWKLSAVVFGRCWCLCDVCWHIDPTYDCFSENLSYALGAHWMYMGQNYQDGKYALFVSFHPDLESKWAIRKPRKNTQLTRTPLTVIGLHCFYCKLAQFKTNNNKGFVKR